MSALRELLATFSFGVDTSALEAAGGATDNLSSQLLDFGKTALKAFALEQVVEFGHEIFETADAVAKQSEALGISTAQLQGWQHAAALSGSSAEEFTAAFTKFTRNVAEAGDSAAGPAAQAFKTLGVDIKDASKQLGQPIDLLDGVVAGLEKIEDPAKRTQVVMDLFGKSGAKLLPLLAEGTDGIAALRAEVEELGFGFDEAFLDNAQEFNDNVDRMKMGLKGLTIQVLGPLLPELVKLSQWLVAGAKSLVAIIKQTNVTQAVMTALGVKALPALMGGLRALGAVALRTILPFLLLDDALTFLAGGDSLIGRGLEKAFGKGTAEAVRKWCEDAGTAIKGTFIGALDLLRIAFADTDQASSKLWQKFELETRPIEAILDAIVDKVKLIAQAFTDLDTLTQGANDFLDLVTSPFDTEEDKAQKAKRRDERYAKEHPLLPAAPDAPAKPMTAAEAAAASAFDNIAARGGAYGPPTAAYPAAPPSVTAPNYADLFRPAAASAPPTTTTVTDNSTTTVAPQTHVHVTLDGRGDDEAVGNRVGSAGAKAAAPINLQAAKRALVPTPGAT